MERAEAAYEERVGGERGDVLVDLLFARLADAGRSDTDECLGRACAEGAKRVAGARELQEIEIDAVGAGIERRVRLRGIATEDEETAGGR